MGRGRRIAVCKCLPSLAWMTADRSLAMGRLIGTPTARFSGAPTRKTKLKRKSSCSTWSNRSRSSTPLLAFLPWALLFSQLQSITS